MAKQLYDILLPRLQELNEYGGIPTTQFISKAVLDAIDANAEADPSVASLRKKLLDKFAEWQGLQHHKGFSAIFETYYEAVFYLVAKHRGVLLRTVRADGKPNGTPDFITQEGPNLAFEVKAIDFAHPERTYNEAMLGGLEAKSETEALARRAGAAFNEQIIRPHGDAKDRREAIEQVMKKIAGNVSADQYASAPTFLIVSLVRASIDESTENLWKFFPWFTDPTQDVSGQLFTIAAHQLGEPFYFFPEWGGPIKNLGAIERAGILHDSHFIPGLVFLVTDWNLTAEHNAVDRAYRLRGIWSRPWEADHALDTVRAAKAVFEKLCHEWNDTEDTHSPSLPKRGFPAR